MEKDLMELVESSDTSTDFYTKTDENLERAVELNELRIILVFPSELSKKIPTLVVVSCLGNPITTMNPFLGLDSYIVSLLA